MLDTAKSFQSVEKIYNIDHAFDSQQSEYALFVADIKKYQHNQDSSTSAPLMGKTVEFLDKRQLKDLFSKPLVKEHFRKYKLKNL